MLPIRSLFVAVVDLTRWSPGRCKVVVIVFALGASLCAIGGVAFKGGAGFRWLAALFFTETFSADVLVALDDVEARFVDDDDAAVLARLCGDGDETLESAAGRRVLQTEQKRQRRGLFKVQRGQAQLSTFDEAFGTLVSVGDASLGVDSASMANAAREWSVASSCATVPASSRLARVVSASVGRLSSLARLLRLRMSCCASDGFFGRAFILLEPRGRLRVSPWPTWIESWNRYWSSYCKLV